MISERYELSWKGRRSGPFTVDEIRGLLRAGEIGLMHQIPAPDGSISVEELLRRVSPPPAPAPPVVVAPEIDPPTPASAPISFEKRPPTALRTISNPKPNYDSPEDSFTPPRFVPLPPSPHQLTRAPSYLPPARPSRSAPVSVSTLASPWIRFVAVFVDGLIAGLLLVPFGVLAENENTPTQTTEAVAIATILLFVALLVTQVVLLSTRGQSLGKMAVGVRIVGAVDSRNPGFGNVVLLRGAVPSLIFAVPVVGWIFWVVDALFIFRDDRRCIHDLMASTVVVKI